MSSEKPESPEPESWVWPLVGKVLGWAWDHPKVIADKFKQLQAWWKGEGQQKAKRDILVIGSGGVGKSTAARFLSGDARSWYESLGVYDESLDIEQSHLKDDPEIGIIVPPGQEHRRDASWDSLLADVSGGKFRGIIVVAAFGYHSLGQVSYRKHRLFKKTKEQFVDDYIADRQTEEVRVLQRLVPHIATCQKKLWMLTLVTKQDLWFKEQNNVVEFYRQGVYGGEIQKLVQKRGQRDFSHSLVLASLVISNFKTGLDEPMLKKNVEGYDHQLQMYSLRGLIEAVSALKDWE